MIGWDSKEERSIANGVFSVPHRFSMAPRFRYATLNSDTSFKMEWSISKSQNREMESRWKMISRRKS